MILMIGSPNRDPEQFSKLHRLGVRRHPIRILLSLPGLICLGAPGDRSGLSSLLNRPYNCVWWMSLAHGVKNASCIECPNVEYE